MYSPFKHPAWMLAAATGVAYGLVLTVGFILFFLLPYLAFASFGA